MELDLYTRRCIGWSLSRSLSTDTALDALQKALYERRNDNLRGLIHHSDQGVQYTSLRFTECLRNHGIQISNSRRGNPYDNAFVESFFKTLKCEEVYTQVVSQAILRASEHGRIGDIGRVRPCSNVNEYDTFKDALNNIGRFIDDVYNEKRMHSALDYLSPMEFEREEGLRTMT